MAERELRDAARDAARAVERSVVPPEFDTVVARGHSLRTRQRRRSVVLSAACVALLGVAVVVPWARSGREPEPAAPPPPTDSQRTAMLLSDPDAVVDEDVLLVDAGGAVLQRVTVASPVGGRCDADRRSALVWHGAEGDSVAWSRDVSGRDVAVVPGGFVVGAPSPGCMQALGDRSADRGAYVVDSTGAVRDVSWETGAEERCAVTPAAVGCLVDAVTASGRVVDGARPVPGPGFIRLTSTGSQPWAASTDAARLAWSRDGGRTWQTHRTTLVPAPGDTVQSTASGDVATFFAWPRAEVTRDHGRTWTMVDLEAALAPVLVANPVLHVTSAGLLAGVSYPTSGRPFVFVSTDPTWARFERSDFRTSRGDFDLGVTGPWLWTHDEGSSWLSRDSFMLTCEIAGLAAKASKTQLKSDADISFTRIFLSPSV